MADDEKHQALLHNGEELGVVDAAESAAMAKTRSKALNLAVSQVLRHAQLQQQQVAQPQKPSIVRWERFLPQQQLRVLLVEDDDSTGHVVTALLRNCGYEVTFASSGLRAWELLMDQSCKVDLVLTEVVMPGLSGIGLLSRIMNLEPLKHIPVIMMSSLDSMGIVFKCLSKGAVDFLVKPVRKNELKNLWQHIWRRCQSSSGSGCGSGSGIGTQKVAQPTIAEEANNNSESDDDLSDSLNSELNLEGGSDNGSGTESAWTKKAVEVKSPHQGVCEGLRMHSAIQSKEACLLEPDYQKGLSADANLAKSGVAPAELPFFGKAQLNLNSAPEMVRPSAADAIDTGQVDMDMGTTDNVYSCVDCQVGNGVNETLIKVQEGAGEQQADSEDDNDLLEKHASNLPSFKDKTFSDSSSPSLLKLSLKRPSEDENGTEGEARGAFKRSRSSAFSRYNSCGSKAPLPAETNSAKINVPPNVFGDYSHARCSSVGSNHPLSRLPSSRIETSFSNIGSDEAMASPFSKGLSQSCSNQNGTLAHTSMSEKWNVGPCFHKEGFHLNTGSGMRTHVYPSPEMHRAFGSCNQPFSANVNLPPQWGCSSEDVEAQELHLPHRFIQGHRSALANQDSEVHLHSHHHHHHVQHHYHCANDQPQQRPQTPPLEDSTVINVGESAPKCGSSNMETCPEDVNGQSGSCNGYGSNGNGAVSLNGSATGSNGGQSVAAIEPAGGIGNVDGNTQGLLVVHGHFLPLDESRHARREAALNKFRQKRKERCFEKKVRYQSRKRLAEQRPRVRGQFVKQSVK